MHFDAIWLCFYSSLWFLHFLTTFFRPCQKAILRVHVWMDMDYGVTQVFSLLQLALSQVTSVRDVQCSVTFPFLSFSAVLYQLKCIYRAVSWSTVLHFLMINSINSVDSGLRTLLMPYMLKHVAQGSKCFSVSKVWIVYKLVFHKNKTKNILQRLLW